MRNIVKLISLASVICFAACTKEVQPQNPDENNTEVSNKIKVGTVNADLKSALDGNTFTWSAGDKISLVYTNGSLTNDPLTIEKTEAPFTASETFAGEMSTQWNSGSLEFCAVSPAVEGTSAFNDGTYTFDQPLVQVQNYTAEGTVDPASLGKYDYQIAGPVTISYEDKNNISMTFSHLMAFINLNVTNSTAADMTIYKVVMNSETDVFPTSATVNFADAAQTPVETKANSVTVELTTAGVAGYTLKAGASTVIRFALIPTLLNGNLRFSYYCTEADEVSSFTVIGLNKQLEAGKSYDNNGMNVKPSMYPLTINSVQAFELAVSEGLFANATETDEIILGANLDFKDKTIAQIPEFKGILNGNGKTISNLVMTAPLFGTINSAKDLTFAETCSWTVPVVSSEANPRLVGSLACISTGALENIANNGAVILNSSASRNNSTSVGGIVGVARGTLTSCINNGAVSLVNTTDPAAGWNPLKSTMVGGIAGYASSAVTSCTNNGALDLGATRFTGPVTLEDITDASISLAGIVASAKSTVTDCSNYGNISYRLYGTGSGSTASDKYKVGGIVATPYAEVSDCENHGIINVNVPNSCNTNFSLSVGGISGGVQGTATSNTSSTTTSCTNRGAITINTGLDSSTSGTKRLYVGGIIGWAGQQGLTDNCHNKASLTETANAITITGGGKIRTDVGLVAGLGNAMSACSTRDVPLTVNGVNNNTTIGGLLGTMWGAKSIINSVVAGNVISTDSEVSAIGGLMGEFPDAAITTAQGCKVQCTINSTSTANTTAANVGLVCGKIAGTTNVVSFGEYKTTGTSAENNAVRIWLYDSTILGTKVTGWHKDTETGVDYYALPVAHQHDNHKLLLVVQAGKTL